MKSIKLPSGAELKVTLAPFSVGKAFYQVCLQEIKSMRLDDNAEIDANLYKDFFCTGFSSTKVDLALQPLIKNALYNDLRITDDLFEPEEARQDYMFVCFYVAKENLLPFTKALTQQYSVLLEQLKKPLA
jgi:hypothetical protein